MAKSILKALGIIVLGLTIGGAVGWVGMNRFRPPKSPQTSDRQPAPVKQPASPTPRVNVIEQPDSLVMNLNLSGDDYIRTVAYGKVVNFDSNKKEILLTSKEKEEAFLLSEDVFVCLLVKSGEIISCQPASPDNIRPGKSVELSLFEKSTVSGSPMVAKKIAIRDY